jgi:hypothetical protein
MVINGNPTPTIVKVQIPLIYLNVAGLYRGKTCQSATDVAAHRLGQVEAYLTVLEVLFRAPFGPSLSAVRRVDELTSSRSRPNCSRPRAVADGVLWRFWPVEGVQREGLDSYLLTFLLYPAR